MGIAALTLDAVGHVEHHTRRAAVAIGRHEALESGDQVLVALAQQHLVAALFEGVDDPLHGLGAILLRTWPTKALMTPERSLFQTTASFMVSSQRKRPIS